MPQQQVKAEATENIVGDKDHRHRRNCAEERFEERPQRIPKNGQCVISQTRCVGIQHIIGFIDGVSGRQRVTYPPEVPVKMEVVGGNIAREAGCHVEQGPVKR